MCNILRCRIHQTLRGSSGWIRMGSSICLGSIRGLDQHMRGTELRSKQLRLQRTCWLQRTSSQCSILLRWGCSRWYRCSRLRRRTCRQLVRSHSSRIHQRRRSCVHTRRRGLRGRIGSTCRCRCGCMGSMGFQEGSRGHHR